MTIHNTNQRRGHLTGQRVVPRWLRCGLKWLRLGPAASSIVMRSAFGLSIASLALPALATDPAAWSEPTAPFRTVGDIYYVGTRGLAAYLIKTNRGLILIDGTLERNVPFVEANIRRLGFDLHDVKVLLISHAHFDHAGGLAQLKKDTGAALYASPGDMKALETGTPTGDTDYGVIRFPAVHVDHQLRDGVALKLGDASLLPLVTPGHTPGCTTFSMRVEEDGHPQDVLFLCSISVAGNLLVGNRGYPGIASDFRRTFRRVQRMHADVVLTAHPELVDVLGRAERRSKGASDAFTMPDMLQKLVGQAQKAFETEFRKESASASRKPTHERR